MVDKIIDTNVVNVVGKVVGEKRFSHEMYGEKFYNFDLEVPRLSDSIDILPITISERLIFNIDINPSQYVIIEGQLRSYNRYVESSNKLVLTIFVRTIHVPGEDELNEAMRNAMKFIWMGIYVKSLYIGLRLLVER